MREKLIRLPDTSARQTVSHVYIELLSVKNIHAGLPRNKSDRKSYSILRARIHDAI